MTRLSKHSAVLLVDLQRDFLSSDGRLPVDSEQVPALLDCAAGLAREAADVGAQVVQVVNEFPARSPLGLFRKFAARQGTAGAELDDRAPAQGAPRFPKGRSDAFSNPALEPWLREREVDHRVVVGVFAEHCVQATVRGARARGFRVTVPRVGVASSSAARVERGLKRMRADGAEVI